MLMELCCDSSWGVLNANGALLWLQLRRSQCLWISTVTPVAAFSMLMEIYSKAWGVLRGYEDLKRLESYSLVMEICSDLRRTHCSWRSTMTWAVLAAYEDLQWLKLRCYRCLWRSTMTWGVLTAYEDLQCLDVLSLFMEIYNNLRLYHCVWKSIMTCGVITAYGDVQ